MSAAGKSNPMRSRLNVLEASDELPLAQTGNRQCLHPPLRRRGKGRGRKMAEQSVLTTAAAWLSHIVEWCSAQVGSAQLGDAAAAGPHVPADPGCAPLSLGPLWQTPEPATNDGAGPFAGSFVTSPQERRSNPGLFPGSSIELQAVEEEVRLALECGAKNDRRLRISLRVMELDRKMRPWMDAVVGPLVVHKGFAHVSGDLPVLRHQRVLLAHGALGDLRRTRLTKLLAAAQHGTLATRRPSFLECDLRSDQL
jgi:hypothetical protein